MCLLIKSTCKCAVLQCDQELICQLRLMTFVLEDPQVTMTRHGIGKTVVLLPSARRIGGEGLGNSVSTCDYGHGDRVDFRIYVH